MEVIFTPRYNFEIGKTPNLSHLIARCEQTPLSMAWKGRVLALSICLTSAENP